MEYLIAFILISLSALFSGLTLGYFTLNPQSLARQAKLGNINAAKILPIRRRGNQLLTTLLLGNVAVNSILSVYLSSLAGGVIAAVSATVLIFLFGEIIPQAVIARHALHFGSTMAPFVRVLMFVMTPITWPIAFSLDRLLGNEISSIYSKDEIMALVSEHEDSEHSNIDEDEERIIHGALRFSHTRVREVMTPKDKVIAFDEEQRLTDEFFRIINEHGYSRYPIYRSNPDCIVGQLYVKDLLIEPSNIKICEATNAYDMNLQIAHPGELLDAVLARMLKSRRHLCLVQSRNHTFMGVISLEDIIEEIMQVEIEDEDDIDE